MSKSKFKTIKLPEDFVNAYIDPLVESSLGYSSRAEVAKDGIRRLNRRDEKENEEKD